MKIGTKLVAHQTKSNQAKALVSNMRSYASKLEQNGELERAELISSWAKVFHKIGTLDHRFLGIASISSFVVSGLYSTQSISGNVIATSYQTTSSILGIGFFSLGLLLGIAYLKNRRAK